MFNRGYNFYNGKRGWSFQIQTLVAMPVKSERAFFIAELEGLLRQMILEDDDKSTEFAEIMEIYEAVTGSRYLNQRTTIPKTRALLDVLLHFEDREFKVLTSVLESADEWRENMAYLEQ